MSIRSAAAGVLRAIDAQREALNGDGHPGCEHDDVLAPGGHDVGGGVLVYDIVGDCARCGGAQYGADYDLNLAVGDLREALGGARNAWEV